MDKTIAGYTLGPLLGQGTYGETFQATKAGQRVALKLIREEAIQQGYDLQRFQREVRALQKAVGPNVVRFLESGTAQLGNETRYYVALEYLEGRDLGVAFKQAAQKFDEPTLKSILTQIISGLKTIHGQNIVHRDLKPANVFLTDAMVIKLLDFGLVKMLDYTTLTAAPGALIGTPLYIAPEILRGEPVDSRADFYSLGVLIYYLITRGSYPFAGDTPLELYAKVINNPPPPPTRQNPAISSAFENIVLTLLTKQPYERSFTHDELTAAIQRTPLLVQETIGVPARLPASSPPKRCFFRLLQTEKEDVIGFVRAGGRLDGFVYPANFLPRYRNSLSALSSLGLRHMLDPVTYRLAYSSFAQTEGVINLPYLTNKGNVLSPADLQTLAAQRDYVQKCLEWQRQWGAMAFVAPFHFCRDLASSWLEIDIKLLEEAVAYGRQAASSLPVYAGMCCNIEAYTIEANRLALLNRYSRARPDGYLFYVDNIDERTNNVVQLGSYVSLLLLFQRLGQPVFGCRVGTMGLGLLAAGVDGIENGVASLSSFSESNLLANRSTGYDMTRKYYIPQIMLTLPVPMAEDILSDARNAKLRCGCSHCGGATRGLDRVAKRHFMYQRVREVAELNALPDTRARLTWFLRRVDEALQLCDTIRRQRVVDVSTSTYVHLRTWRQVFGAL
jgi:serine/threonine-protein kinase